MFLFSYPYNMGAIYEALGKKYREVPTVEPVAPDGDLGRALQPLADLLGNGAVVFEMFFFPKDHNAAITIEDRPNSHIYQLLGYSIVDGQTLCSGHVASLTTNTVIAQSVVYSPCLFARISVEHRHESVKYPDRGAQNPVEFTPQPVDPERFKSLMVEDNFLAADLCADIIASLDPSSQGYGSVLTDAASNTTALDKDIRSVNMMKTRRQNLVDRTLNDIVTGPVEKFFETTMEFWNTPVLLKYEPGDFFIPHVDSEKYDNGNWVRIYDRDYTLVVFLNDDYEGGELAFPDYSYEVKPKTGRIVCFPGDHTFRHGANETRNGTRYQLVSWLTAYGTPRTNWPPNPTVLYRQW